MQVEKFGAVIIRLKLHVPPHNYETLMKHETDKDSFDHNYEVILRQIFENRVGILHGSSKFW